MCLLCQRHWDQVAQKSLSSRFFIPTSLPNYTLIIHSQLLFKVFSFYIQGPTFSRTEVQCRFCWCKGEYNVSKLKWKKFIYEILSQERVNSCCRLGLLSCLWRRNKLSYKKQVSWLTNQIVYKNSWVQSSAMLQLYVEVEVCIPTVRTGGGNIWRTCLGINFILD